MTTTGTWEYVVFSFIVLILSSLQATNGQLPADSKDDGSGYAECNAAELGQFNVTSPPSDERCMNATGSVSIWNGVVCYNGTSTGSNATYHCDTTYNSFYQLAYGDRERVCQNNGTWNGTMPICIDATGACWSAVTVNFFFSEAILIIEGMLLMLVFIIKINWNREHVPYCTLSLICRRSAVLKSILFIFMVVFACVIADAVFFANARRDGLSICIFSNIFIELSVVVAVCSSFVIPLVISAKFPKKKFSWLRLLRTSRRKFQVQLKTMGWNSCTCFQCENSGSEVVSTTDSESEPLIQNRSQPCEECERNKALVTAKEAQCTRLENAERQKSKEIENLKDQLSTRDKTQKALLANKEVALKKQNKELQNKCQEIEELNTRLTHAHEYAKQLQSESKKQQSDKQMESLRETLRQNETDLVPTQMQLENKQKELDEKSKELNEKSALMVQLENDLEEMRQRFEEEKRELSHLCEIQRQEIDHLSRKDTVSHNRKLSSIELQPHHLLNKRVFNLPRVSRYYNCVNAGPPVPFIDEVVVLSCDSKGQQYTNIDHDITINIPEGAIPPGQTAHLEVAVALYGPFSFASDRRPISPILWICMQEDVELQKAVEISLPHFLLGLTEDERETFDVKFAKASHDIFYDPSSHQNTYQFQPIEDETQFVSDGRRSYGILKTNHFCFTCIDQKQDPAVAKRAGYSLTCIKYPLPNSKSVLYFCVTFFLDSCLRVLDKQFLLRKQYCGVTPEIRTLCFKFNEQPKPYLEMVYPTGYEDKCVIALESPHGKKMLIYASEVDYWEMDKDELKRKQDHDMHPPRLKMEVRTKPNVSDYRLQLKFLGCSDEGSLDMEVILPLDSTTIDARTPTVVENVPRDTWHRGTRLTTEKHYLKLRSFLGSHAYLWRAIGLELGFQPYELNNIQSNPQLLMSTTSFLDKMIEDWLQWAPGDGRRSKNFATFEDLHAALLNVNGMAAKAYDLEKALLGGSEVQHQTYTILQPTPSVSPDSVTRPPDYEYAAASVQLETTDS